MGMSTPRCHQHEKNMKNFPFSCERNGGDCGGDGPSFKGVFNRNLGELDKVLEGRPYRNWLVAQTDSLYRNNRNSLDQYGVHWEGPFDRADAARQHSALDAFNGAHLNESRNEPNSSQSMEFRWYISFTLFCLLNGLGNLWK